MLALSAWQKGETIESMKQASPSIIVSDKKWTRGDKLTKFEINGPGRLSGSEKVFSVTLWVEGAKGKRIKETTEYSVGTSPSRTVFRAVFD